MMSFRTRPGSYTSGVACCLLLCSCSVYDELLLDTESVTGTNSGGKGGVSGKPSVSGNSGGMSGSSGSGGNSGGEEFPTDSGVAKDSAVDEVCGDGRVTGSEKCDIGIKEGQTGACPSECPAANGCFQWQLVGSGCDIACEQITNPACEDGDDCCPKGCTKANDSDCSASCGDGIVQTDEGEVCEPRSALEDNPDADALACPTQCEEDDDPCTTWTITGSEDNCSAVCSMAEITSITEGDGCCPKGANANTDLDCKPKCGNGVREGNEECDGVDGCDDQCKSTLTPEQRTCYEVDPIHNDECIECLCTNCTNQALLCLNSGNASVDEKCAEVLECGYRTGCTGPYCYCGPAVDPLTQNCLFGIIPNGPCKAEIEEAAGTADMVMIFLQRADPNTAVGRATLFSTCDQINCYNICHPTS